MTSQRGQGAVEIVLLAPLMMVLVFLIWEAGRVFGSWLLLTNAVREGARFAITRNCDTFASDPAIANQIRNRVSVTAQFLVVDATACTGSSSQNSCVNVTRGTSGSEAFAQIYGMYRVFTLTPIAGTIPYLGSINYPGYMEIRTYTTMRCE